MTRYLIPEPVILSLHILNREILSWAGFGGAGTDLTGNVSQTVGGVNVGVTVTDEGNLAAAEVSNATQYVGSDPFATNSALYFEGSGGIDDTASVTIDFSAEDGSGKASAVSTITVDGNDSLVGNTVTGETTNDASSDQDSSIKIDIAGPVRQIIVDYDNGGTGGQVLNITDIHFTTLTETGDNDDSVEAGAGDDFIDTALANDTVDGGTGDDTIIAGAGNDSLMGGDDQDTFQTDDNFGTDTIVGGEGGTDNDILDASNLTAAVDVTFTGDEAGDLTAATGSAEFSEIEDFVLTDFDDSLDGSAASTPIEVIAGDGNDTITGGSGKQLTDPGCGRVFLNDRSSNDRYRRGRKQRYVWR